MDDRVSRQIAFLVEADKLKSILRRTTLADGTRQENSAEHSWHLVLAAIVLQEHLAEACNLVRVLELVAVHDLVEIDAGDTFAYDVESQSTKVARERAAADRIFGLLPSDQGEHVRRLWDEFEEQATSEARFASALDSIQPLLLNAASGGGSWRTHDVTREQVLARMAPVKRMLPALWPSVQEIVDAFCASGMLRRRDD